MLDSGEFCQMFCMRIHIGLSNILGTSLLDVIPIELGGVYI